jgi:hypothetical protein
MTDARDAEAAARGLVVSDAQNYPGFSTLLNAYRDTIEKRVRGERDAEAVAAERARWVEAFTGMCVRCESGWTRDAHDKECVEATLRALSERSDG